MMLNKANIFNCKLFYMQHKINIEHKKKMINLMNWCISLKQKKMCKSPQPKLWWLLLKNWRKKQPVLFFKRKNSSKVRIICTFIFYFLYFPLKSEKAILKVSNITNTSDSQKKTPLRSFFFKSQPIYNKFIPHSVGLTLLGIGNRTIAIGSRRDPSTVDACTLSLPYLLAAMNLNSTTSPAAALCANYRPKGAFVRTNY
jgi:hypothetical protein